MEVIDRISGRQYEYQGRTFRVQADMGDSSKISVTHPTCPEMKVNLVSYLDVDTLTVCYKLARHNGRGGESLADLQGSARDVVEEACAILAKEIDEALVRRNAREARQRARQDLTDFLMGLPAFAGASI